MSQPKPIWRDLKCTQCQNPSGWTMAHLIEVMNKDYEMRYYCDHCQVHTLNKFIGQPYARDSHMKRIEQVFDFETTGNTK